jgi:hypothetical protein
MTLIFSRLYTLHGSNSSWLFFCESHTAIDLFQVLQLLNKYSPTEVRTVFNLSLIAIHICDEYTGYGNGRRMELAEKWAVVLNLQVLLCQGSLL